MIRTSANGQPAAAAYHRDRDGIYRAFGLGTLTMADAGMSRIFVFGDRPGLVATVDLPPLHPNADAPPVLQR